MWPCVKAKDENNSVLDIPSRLLEDRIILLTEEISDSLATSIVSQLLYLEMESPTSEITIYINSPGGSISAGMAIYDVMNNIKCPINTVCMGMAASMAAFILCSGTKGKRYCLPNSTVMIHQPLGGTQGQATELEIYTMHILEVRRKTYEIIAKNCGKSFDEISKACERDNYLSAKEALSFGLVDEVVDCHPKAYSKPEEVN